MKRLNWQLCEPELAARLKVLGCIQVGTWFYENGQDKAYMWLPDITPIDLIRCIAYTSAELGVMLPDYVPTKRIIAGNFFTGEQHSIWSCVTETNPVTGKNAHIDIGGGPSEASIRASMLIFLLEEGHLSVDEVNSRLEAAMQ